LNPYLPFCRSDDLRYRRFLSWSSRFRSRCLMLHSRSQRSIGSRLAKTSSTAPEINIYKDVHRGATAVRVRSIIAPIMLFYLNRVRVTPGGNALLGAAALLGTTDRSDRSSQERHVSSFGFNTTETMTGPRGGQLREYQRDCRERVHKTRFSCFGMKLID